MKLVYSTILSLLAGKSKEFFVEELILEKLSHADRYSWKGRIKGTSYMPTRQDGVENRD